MVVCAFPTLGKTTLARRIWEMGEVAKLPSPVVTVADVDLGWLRRMRDGLTTSQWLPAYNALVAEVEKTTDLVFINEPRAANYSLMLLPLYGRDEAVHRLINRGDGDDDFARRLSKQYDEWVQEWAQIALARGVEVHWTTSCARWYCSAYGVNLQVSARS